MTYKLFIDDERFPIGDDWVIARSSSDATQILNEKGIPNYISFDHDLGGIDTSIIFINNLIDFLIDNSFNLPDNFDFFVHSQNPIGAENIKNLMNNLIRFFGNKDKMAVDNP